MSHPNPRPWQIEHSTPVLDSPWLRVESQRVTTGAGTTIEAYYQIREPTWALAIPRLPDGRLVLVDQYRHGIGGASLEFPAGDCERDRPDVAVLRELGEETGYRASGPALPLGALHSDPSRSNGTGHGFLVPVDPEPGPTAWDETEEMAIELLAPEALWAAVAAGRMSHGIHVAFLAIAARRGLL